MSEIVVSIATISQRISNLAPVLESLLCNQSLSPHRIVVWISPEPFLLDKGCEYSDLPEKVRSWHEHGKLEIRTTVNTGPHRKMMPLLLQHQKDPDPPILVTADDDVLYPSKWLETLVYAHQKTGNAVCFRGRVIARTGTCLKPYRTWSKLAAYEEARSRYIFATGREGLLIRANMFDQRTFTSEYLRLSRSRCDAWMTAGLIAAGTEMYKLSVARLFPDPHGLKLVANRSLPAPRPTHATSGKSRTQNKEADLWCYNRDKNDTIINETFRYFGIIGGTPKQTLEC